MITEIEYGYEDSCSFSSKYVKLYFDDVSEVTEEGPIPVLKALRAIIDADIKRREAEDGEKKCKAVMEIYRAAADVCRKYGVKLTVEVKR